VKERDHLEEIREVRIVILKWNCEKCNWTGWTGLIWRGIKKYSGLFSVANETLVSI
jgi:uncharacterized protein with PIN domain